MKKILATAVAGIVCFGFGFGGSYNSMGQGVETQANQIQQQAQQLPTQTQQQAQTQIQQQTQQVQQQAQGVQTQLQNRVQNQVQTQTNRLKQSPQAQRFKKARSRFKNMGQLTPQERNSLIHMREEEKLARDVYLTLYRKWKVPIFRNIARSERMHMKRIGYLLRRYKVEDPVRKSGGKIGVFSDPKLQALYNQLVAQGSKSLVEGLKVGATIEDLDIKDLQDSEKMTNKKDILWVYRNLEKGSRNHMRAFVRALKRYQVTYTPQYISSQYFQQIISTPWERGPVRK